MATPEYLPSGFISVAGNNLHASGCTAVAITLEVAEEDATSLASEGWHEAAGGKKSGSVSLSFNNNSAIEAAMAPLLGTVVEFEIRKTQSTASPTNPKWTGSLFVSAWAPVDSKAEGLNQQSQTYVTSGPVTKATS